MEGQMSVFDLGIWSGKMSPERSPAERQKEKISGSSLKKQQGSPRKMPLFLDLRSGATVEPSWEMGGLLLGAYTTHSFGESPNEENVSRLSQILEDSPLPKYSLSERACLGILSRAARRGKELPPELKEALEAQSLFKSEQENLGGARESLSRMNTSEHCPPSTTRASSIGCDVYNQVITGDTAATVTASAEGTNTSEPKVLTYGIDQQGGKGGANYAENVIPTLASDSHGTPHAVCKVLAVDQGGEKSQANVTEDQAPTLATTHGGEPAVCYGISAFDSNSMKSDNPTSGIYKAETSRTPDLNGGSPACNKGGVAVIQRRFSSVNVFDNGVTPTLEAGAGEGGNNMPMVLAFDAYNGVESECNGTLRASAAHNTESNNLVRVEMGQ